MQPPKMSGSVKPTQDTKFHIDYTWWERNNEDLRTYLLSHLPAEQRDRLMNTTADQKVDFIDPDTGEVFQEDEIGMALKNAAKDPNFINPHSSVVDSVFRVFVANNNQPLSPRELGDILGRPAATILKTLAGVRVYYGIRPTD